MRRSIAVEQLLIILTQGIAEGRWLPGQPLPTTRHLAGELDVSAPTVAKAIRIAAERGLVELRRSKPAAVRPDACRVADEILNRLRALKVPDTQSHLTRIALLYPDVDWPDLIPPHAAVRRYVDIEAEKAGLVFDLMPWPMKSQVLFARSLAGRGYAGAVCLGMRSHYQIGLAALHDQGFPAVVINRQFRHLNLPAIAMDPYKPPHDMALRLIGMGHRSLTMVCDLLQSSDMGVHGSIRGWVDGLVEGGVLESCSVPVYVIPGLPALVQRPQAFDELLLRPNRPTALFLTLDLVLRDPRFAARFRIPDDISVVLATREPPPVLPDAPPLTTLDNDYRRIAECVVQTMIDLINGKSCPKLLLLSPKLELTESIGPPSTH